MNHRTGALGSAVLSLAIAASGAPAVVFAQSGAAGSITAPDYGSGASAGALSDGNFNTPEADGRPGVQFFTLGVQAFRKHDYRHAIDMYKVAASWAYKPAEYNLAIMYFKGQGVPADRALGAAWMVLAAERGAPEYVKARDLMVTVLSKAEFARTDELWGELKQTYGDKVAFQRAKARWNWVGSHETGTHITGGIPGYLRAGEEAPMGVLGSKVRPTTAVGLLSAGSMDGSVAYRQFQRSRNPYDPAFQNNRTGAVTVEPLQSKKSSATQPGDNKGGVAQPPPSSSPPQGA